MYHVFKKEGAKIIKKYCLSDGNILRKEYNAIMLFISERYVAK